MKHCHLYEISDANTKQAMASETQNVLLKTPFLMPLNTVLKEEILLGINGTSHIVHHVDLIQISLQLSVRL